MTASDLPPASGAVPAIWGNVPQRNKNFTGRDDILAHLRQGVSSTVTAVLPHALQGMGGVGKTAVAIEYAHRYRSEYEVVWWIPADQPALVRSSLAALAEPIGLQWATATGIEGAASAVLDALRRGEPFAHWLLIFDNADQPEDLNEIIPRGPGDVLITSADEQAGYRHEAHLILAAGAPKNPDDNRLWPRYAELVPHAGSATTELAHCRDRAVRAFALDVIRYLYSSGDHASARPFAERFIAQWTKDSGPDDPSVLAAQRHLGNALRELGDYSAAYTVIEKTLDRARVILGQQEPLTLALTSSFGADLRARGDFTTARTMDEESVRLHREVFGQEDPQTLRAMHNLALDHGVNSDYGAARALHQRTYVLQSEATSGVTAAEVLGSWNGLARAVRLCGDYTEARDVGEDAHDYGREALGPEHYLTLRAAKDLSIALRRIATAYDDALELAWDVFNRCGRLLGAAHPDTLAAAISLTNIQRTTGQTDQALALAASTVASYPAIYGPDHPYSHACSANLALLRRVTGDPAGARQMDESALVGLDARLTRDHHYSLTVATNLASDLAALGEIAKARVIGKDTLVRLRALMGENHPITLGCAANLVADLRAEDVEDEAEQLSADTLNRYAATLGTDHPDTRVAAGGQRLDFDFDPPPI